jgi:hypothetical protein
VKKIGVKLLKQIWDLLTKWMKDDVAGERPWLRFVSSWLGTIVLNAMCLAGALSRSSNWPQFWEFMTIRFVPVVSAAATLGVTALIGYIAVLGAPPRYSYVRIMFRAIVINLTLWGLGYVAFGAKLW